MYFLLVRDSGSDEYAPVITPEIEDSVLPTPNEQTQPDESQDYEETPSPSPNQLGLNLTPAPLASLYDTGYLKMVNRTLPVHRIQEDRFVSAHPTVAVSTTEVRLHETALEAIAGLFRRGHTQGFNAFFVSSGIRTIEHQQYLWDNRNRAYLMEPGHSEHHLGLAADILATGINMSTMAGTPEAAFLAANAWRYGLILRYPQSREYITEVPYEPWHFRYVGRVHAWYMYRNNLVLEEYLPLLEEHEMFSVELEGRTYYIIYQRPVNGFIQVPDLDFRLSTSNRGGYVITAWR